VQWCACACMCVCRLDCMQKERRCQSPLPPNPVSNFVPLSVSPGIGARGTYAIKSVLHDPTTTTSKTDAAIAKEAACAHQNCRHYAIRTVIFDK
jgi:hypothetical protein